MLILKTFKRHILGIFNFNFHFCGMKETLDFFIVKV